jgi:hypothetical protein
VVVVGGNFQGGGRDWQKSRLLVRVTALFSSGR